MAVHPRIKLVQCVVATEHERGIVLVVVGLVYNVR